MQGHRIIFCLKVYKYRKARRQSRVEVESLSATNQQLHAECVSRSKLLAEQREKYELLAVCNGVQTVLDLCMIGSFIVKIISNRL